MNCFIFNLLLFSFQAIKKIKKKEQVVSIVTDPSSEILEEFVDYDQIDEDYQDYSDGRYSAEDYMEMEGEEQKGKGKDGSSSSDSIGGSTGSAGFIKCITY